MPRFFVDPAAFDGEAIALVGQDAHHAAVVLRLAPGAAVTALDGSGRVFACEVAEVAKGAVRLRVRAIATEPPARPAVTLYQGLPKGDKLELVIQKATELGVARIVPLAAARSVVKLEQAKLPARLARWSAIAREAAEQSERATVPAIEAPASLEALALAGGVKAYVLAERTAGLPLLRALPPDAPSELALFVGPEGGWDARELARLAALGAEPVSLGPRILRTETAGLAALAIVAAAYDYGMA